MKTAFQKLSPHLKISKPYEDPTTMKRLPKSIYNDEEVDDPLLKQLKRLEEEWDCIKQSISRSNRRNTTTDSIATVAVDHRLFQMYDKSPKELMMLLQDSPSEEDFWNSRHHDLVAIEIMKEREADFDNGRFRGRRLFEESEVGSDDDGGTQGESSDMHEESEVCTEFSYKASENHDGNYTQLKDSPPSDVAERNIAVVTLKSAGGGGRSVRRWMICVVIMLFALGIFAFKCSGQGEQILVPT